MIAESNGTITKVVLRNNNAQYFLDDVCAALVSSGWTEVTTPSVSDYPWNSLYINHSYIQNDSWIEVFPGERFYWKTTPTLPTHIPRSTTNVKQNLINMGSTMLSQGAIQSYHVNLEPYDHRIYYTVNRPKDFRLATIGELGVDYRIHQFINVDYDEMYRSGPGFYNVEYYEPAMWGYKKFDSPVSPDGTQIRLWVGWQSTADYFNTNLIKTYPCFKITSVDEVVDPLPGLILNTRIIRPKWNPCVDITDKGLTWDMVCGPYWFYIAARGNIGTRKWVYGGSIKLFEGNIPYNVTIEPAGYTIVHFDRPHNYHPGQYLTFARVNATESWMANINGQPWEILDVPDEMTVRLVLNTAPFTYSSGIAGSDNNPVNVGFIYSADGLQTGIPRVTTSSATGAVTGCYIWNDTSWSSGGTGTSGVTTGSANQHARMPTRVRKWHGDQYSIYEPIVGWSEFFSSTRNYCRGMLWDSFMVNRGYTLDLEQNVDSKNWKQVMDPSSGSSCWIRIP